MPLYKQDPNDSTKQVPDDMPSISGTSKFSYAIAPAKEVMQKRPTYVMLNNAGNYLFAYDSASAATACTTTNYITASVLDADAGPVKLDIQPLAWTSLATSGGEKTGDVTFVYVRVR